ncbi:MAG: hypothetical protein U0736_18605 [Gemmataceae bacterium]
MSTGERTLIWLLRGCGVVLACALPAAFLPTGWMDAVHRAVGLGELPRTPLVEYLTRSLSLLYASYSPLYFLASDDVRRYRTLILVLAITHGGSGFLLFGLDLWAGMPLPWTLTEGPMVVLLGVSIAWLVRRLPPDPT